MILNQIKHIYLLGIGGIGMSALARYFRAGGLYVCGYDKTPTALTAELIAEGIPVHFEDDVSLLPDFLKTNQVNDKVLVIYTPAIPKDHKEFNLLKAAGYRMWKRSEVLGLLTKGTPTLAVAGTHGKTTTSTMIAHIMKENGVNCTAFLGGISKNYNTNLLLGDSAGSDHMIVVEADEYDRSFLQLHPAYAMITSLDADHLDIYGDRDAMVESYRQFAGQVSETGKLVVKGGSEKAMSGLRFNTYSLSSDSDYHAKNIRVENGSYVFDIVSPQKTISNMVLNWPGRHNVENAVGAYALCSACGIKDDEFRNALASFEGVKRRFDYQIRTKEVIYIDDYAHHPEELRACIASVKELYPGQKVLGIFQPHLFTRTRDFADGFGESLSMLDELIMLDIYPARELPIPGVTSELILDKVTTPHKQLCSRDNWSNAVLNSNARVVLTLGAGDIDQIVGSVKNLLSEKYLKQNA